MQVSWLAWWYDAAKVLTLTMCNLYIPQSFVMGGAESTQHLSLIFSECSI